MANNVIQVKRTSVSGRAANTTTLTNAGELGLNMADGILYSTNGTFVFEIGANLTSARVTTGWFAGNSTLNVSVNATTVRLANSTANINITTPSAAAISGGNYYLNANGQWAVVSGSGSPGGSNTQVQYNASGSFAGNANLTFDAATGYFTVGSASVNTQIRSDATVRLANSTSNIAITIPSAAAVSAGNYYLNANGQWVVVTGGSGSPGGSNTFIQYNASGSFAGNAAFTFDVATTRVFLGNTTANAALNVSSLWLSNSTSNTHIDIPTSAQFTSTSHYLNANGQWAAVAYDGGVF